MNPWEIWMNCCLTIVKSRWELDEFLWNVGEFWVVLMSIKWSLSKFQEVRGYFEWNPCEILVKSSKIEANSVNFWWYTTVSGRNCIVSHVFLSMDLAGYGCIWQADPTGINRILSDVIRFGIRCNTVGFRPVFIGNPINSVAIRCRVRQFPSGSTGRIERPGIFPSLHP